jgi:DNA-binding SARP family transcriptional activator/class 3 adenylate cyclase/tetratricopeptide (TPR) repeat protein
MRNKFTQKNNPLHLELLGGFNVRVVGATTGIGYAKLCGLLAFLAMSGRTPQRREYLAELFWSEMPMPAGRQNLRRALYNLKSALGVAGKLLSAERDLVTLDHLGLSLDVSDFTMPVAPTSPVTLNAVDGTPDLEQMEYQAGLYRGEFMSGFYLPDCSVFEDWVQVQRESLHRHALALLEKLSERYLHMGDYGKSLPFALRYTELEPWDEAGYRRVMRILAFNKQTGAALAQYEICRRRLKDELGTNPSTETRRLFECIRSGELQENPFCVAEAPLSQTMPRLAAERRQVTVLYCELFLSSTAIDPDEAVEQLHTPQTRCMEIIHNLFGHIVQAYGGSLLAYFGYPQANEHAARHAVQAALSIVRDTAKGIELRCGIHTGLILTGGELMHPDISGITTRLAIHLCQHAAHNGIVISKQTCCLVEGYFDCVSLGAQIIPGISNPLEIFTEIKDSGVRTRLGAASQLTPMVGRKPEVADLIQLWESARHGSTHVVLVQGEAGMGKSRLAHALKQHIAGQSCVVRELHCFPEFSLSPFQPLIGLFESVIGFEPGDTPELKLAKLEKHLAKHYPSSKQNALPFIAQLINLPLAESCLVNGLSALQQKQETIHILLTLLQELATQQPTLLILEDLHWIDPSTLELLTQFIEHKGKAPILLILTARTEFDPPWNETFDKTLTLAPLDDQEVAEMAVSLNVHIPDFKLQRIVERANGIPLFIEEISKTETLDNGFDIPLTLRDLLTARMDKLGEAKPIIQLAATIGREFDLELLRKICPDDRIGFVLKALRDSEMVLNTGEATYQFKHALIQEAAYHTQTKANRMDMHRRIAQVLQSDFTDLVTTRPELLAQHLSAAGEIRQAVEFWLKAGLRAIRSSANLEAIEHFSRGLKLLATLPPSEEIDRLEFEFRINRGVGFVSVNGYGAVETEQEYTRAHELGMKLGEDANLFKALWGMWLNANSQFDHLFALELAEKLLELAVSARDSIQLQQAYFAIGRSQLWLGQLERSRTHLELSMSLYHPSQHEAMAYQYGKNTCVVSGTLLTWVLWLQGFPQQAEDIHQQTLALARHVHHPNSLGYALSVSSIFTRWLKQVERTSQLAQEAITLSQAYRLSMGVILGKASHGWVQIIQGNPQGITHILHSMEAVNSVFKGFELIFFALLCDSYVHLRKFGEALVVTEEALVIAHTKHDRFFESEFMRLKGESLLGIAETNTAAAEACFSQALMVSRQQGAKSLELRAAMSMAQLWQKQNRQADARRVLQEVYRNFTEGFDTANLQEAADLLRTLN